MRKEKEAMPHKSASHKQTGVDIKEKRKTSEKSKARKQGKPLGKNIVKSSERNTKTNKEPNIKRIQNNKEKEIQGKKVEKNKSICPIEKKCGGCQLLNQSYEQQLKDKQKLVEGLIGKFCKVDNIIGMDNPYHYRNKVHAVFDHDRKGNPISGVYELGTHRVVPVEKCMIENENADEIINSIRGLLKSFKLKPMMKILVTAYFAMY